MRFDIVEGKVDGDRIVPFNSLLMRFLYLGLRIRVDGVGHFQFSFNEIQLYKL